MFSELTNWLLGLVKQFFADLWQFFLDLFLSVLEGLLDALASLISALGVPEFLSSGLQSGFGLLDPGITWLITQLGIPAALGVVGAGYTFRILRKLITLFQW